jgi:hypothetical protein
MQQEAVVRRVVEVEAVADQDLVAVGVEDDDAFAV